MSVTAKFTLSPEQSINFWRIPRKEKHMRRSKLEMYMAILKALAQRGPMRLTHIMYKANVNCTVLKECMAYLIKQGLVEERAIKKRCTKYAITARGITILKYFRELQQALPISDENSNHTLPMHIHIT
ncbi:MAG: winged helix-turn-helix domain-containing protein [Candidatus Bathyarchaeia archaeon]